MTLAYLHPSILFSICLFPSFSLIPLFLSTCLLDVTDLTRYPILYISVDPFLYLVLLSPCIHFYLLFFPISSFLFFLTSVSRTNFSSPLFVLRLCCVLFPPVHPPPLPSRGMVPASPRGPHSLWWTLLSFPRGPSLGCHNYRRGSLPSVPPRVAQAAMDTALDAFGMPMGK